MVILDVFVDGEETDYGFVVETEEEACLFVNHFLNEANKFNDEEGISEDIRFVLDGKYEFVGCPPYGPNNLTICLEPIE